MRFYCDPYGRVLNFVPFFLQNNQFLHLLTSLNLNYLCDYVTLNLLDTSLFLKKNIYRELKTRSVFLAPIEYFTGTILSALRNIRVR